MSMDKRTRELLTQIVALGRTAADLLQDGYGEAAILEDIMGKRYIDAIKAVRNNPACNLSLREAKDLIDRLEQEGKWQRTDRRAAAAQEG